MGGGGRTAVLIPWREGCPHREAALKWVVDRWRSAGYEPVIGECPTGPWRKASAVAAALARTSASVLIVADADVWVDVSEAVAAVGDGAPWAVPHGPVRRLAEEATRAVLAGAPLGDGPLTEPAYRGVEGGGVTVLPRDLYEVSPLDPRFAGWGQEDEAWGIALRAVAGRAWRGSAPLYHLWHPPQNRLSRRWGSRDGMTLYRRYRHAARRPEEVRFLLAEIGGPHGVA